MLLGRIKRVSGIMIVEMEWGSVLIIAESLTDKELTRLLMGVSKEAGSPWDPQELEGSPAEGRANTKALRQAPAWRA